MSVIIPLLISLDGVSRTYYPAREDGDIRKFDGLGVADQAFLVGILTERHNSRPDRAGQSEAAMKALAVKIAEDKSETGDESRREMKALMGIEPSDMLNAALA